jgi:hypothetical protein
MALADLKQFYLLYLGKRVQLSRMSRSIRLTPVKQFTARGSSLE